VGFGEIRPVGEGLRKALGRLIEAAFLQRDHAEKVKGVHMSRIEIQNLPVDLLGPAQVPGAMQLHGLFHVQYWSA